MRKDLYHPTWNNLRIVSAQCCNYRSIKDIITSDITGCFVSYFVLAGDVLFFQPNIEFAAELNMVCSHDPDPLHKPSIIDPKSVFKT